MIEPVGCPVEASSCQGFLRRMSWLDQDGPFSLSDDQLVLRVDLVLEAS